MNVQTYLFQSPSTSPVQVGRPDPSFKSDDSSSQTSSQVKAQVKQAQPVHETQAVSVNTVAGITPNVESTQLLDVYA